MFVAYDTMRGTVHGAYSHTSFTFQMGVNPGVPGCEPQTYGSFGG